MKRFDLTEERPLNETEQYWRVKYGAAVAGRMPLELLLDPQWPKMIMDCPMPSKLERLPGGKKSAVQLQRHDRYFPISMHSHVWLELLCVVHGRCAHRVGTASGVLQQGDVLVITPGTQHSFLSADEDCIIYNVYLPLEQFERDFDSILRSQSVLSNFLLKTLYADGRDSYLIFHCGDYFLGENYLAELWSEWCSPGEQHQSRLVALMTMFFLDLLRVQMAPVTVSIDAPADSRERILLDYVRSHSADVSVAQLSQIFSYSERQITRIFQQTVSMSCIDYIQQCRREHFLSLLVSTDLSISRIQELAGIRSPQQFYRDFKARYGMSPRAYRAAASDSAQYRAEVPVPTGG